MAQPGSGLNLLPDVPAELEADDFAHVSYAEVLRDAVTSADHPITIGLFGPWGVGKSSVLERLRKDLDSADCTMFVFDAWRYDGSTLRRQLLRDLATRLATDKRLRRGFKPHKELAQLEVDRQVTRSRIVPTWDAFFVVVLQTLAVAAAVYGVLQFDAVSDALSAQTPTRGTFITVAASAVVFVATLVANIFRAAPTAITHKRLEDPERFQELFVKLLRHTKSERLVIAIDNLDRSTPRDALDLLSTVKTYLEPAAQRDKAAGDVGARVVFVISVDDAALRDALTSEPEARGKEDEYLRKLFAATIRFVPLLGEDVRDHVRRRIVEVQPSLQLTAEQERDLVSLIDASRRTTPRQILQFLNNLQLRLHLIRKREQGDDPVIGGRLSREPLVIAKLMLLQEGWPRAYDALLEQPHLLDTWHDIARGTSSQGIVLPDYVGDAEALAAFLRVSDTIRTDHLTPFLRLKQSADELTLPGYGELRAASARGDRQTVDRIVGDADPELTARYAARLTRTFSEELQSEYFPAAKSILDVLCASETLRPHAAAAVRIAVDTPRFRDQWLALAPPHLLSASRPLDPGPYARVLDGVVEQLTNASADRAAAAASALADAWHTLTPRHLERVRQVTATSPLAAHFRALDILLAQDPSLCSAETAQAVVAGMGQPEQLIAPDGDHLLSVLERLTDAGLFRAAPTALAQGIKVAGADRLIRDEVERGSRLIALARWLSRDGADLEPLVAEWRASFAQVEVRAELRSTLADLLWDTAVQHPDAAELNGLLRQFLRDGGLPDDRLTRLVAELPDDLIEPAEDALFETIAAHESVQERGIATAVGAFPDRGRRIVRQVVLNLLGSGDELDRAWRLVTEHHLLEGPDGEVFAERLIAASRSPSVPGPFAIRVLARLAHGHATDAAALPDALISGLREALQRTTPENLDPDLVALVLDATQGRDVQQLLEAIVALITAAAPPHGVALADGILPHVHVLTPEQRGAIASAALRAVEATIAVQPGVSHILDRVTADASMDVYMTVRREAAGAALLASTPEESRRIFDAYFQYFGADQALIGSLRAARAAPPSAPARQAVEMLAEDPTWAAGPLRDVLGTSLQ